MHFKHVDNQSVSFVGLYGASFFKFINTEYVINKLKYIFMIVQE